MTATINVSLAPCSMKCHKDSSHGHFRGCAAFPVLIPCPIPRSVTFHVVLGECDKRCATWATASAPYGKAPDGTHHVHHDRCPARPIRVSCSISGETWEGSKVAEVTFDSPYAKERMAQGSIDTYAQICRARWGYVKSALLGHSLSDCPEAVHNMRAQRDAVFAALCEMRRAENLAHAAFLALPMDLRKASIISKQCGPTAANPDDGGIDLPSAKIFALYVERLIEQVGVLP